MTYRFGDFRRRLPSDWDDTPGKVFASAAFEPTEKSNTQEITQEWKRQ